MHNRITGAYLEYYAYVNHTSTVELVSSRPSMWITQHHLLILLVHSQRGRLLLQLELMLRLGGCLLWSGHHPPALQSPVSLGIAVQVPDPRLHHGPLATCMETIALVAACSAAPRTKHTPLPRSIAVLRVPLSCTLHGGQDGRLAARSEAHTPVLNRRAAPEGLQSSPDLRHKAAATVIRRRALIHRRCSLEQRREAVPVIAARLAPLCHQSTALQGHKAAAAAPASGAADSGHVRARSTHHRALPGCGG
mmetsp:Transcript_4675/g.10135  ORF Transcript_4675/g.10135 Transcript_4675/m.10135 type:complete len:250 (+) Transcript_4675:386-1135(+)